MSEERYEYVTYGTSRFHIPDGMYTIEQIKDILQACEQMKAIHDANLKRSIQPTRSNHATD